MHVYASSAQTVQWQVITKAVNCTFVLLRYTYIYVWCFCKSSYGMNMVVKDYDSNLKINDKCLVKWEESKALVHSRETTINCGVGTFVHKVTGLEFGMKQHHWWDRAHLGGQIKYAFITDMARYRNKTHHWKEQTKISKWTNCQTHTPKYREAPSIWKLRLL